MMRHVENAAESQRKYLVPDNVNWKDTGCELYPSCLRCPRETCIEEEPRAILRERLNDRAMEMMALREEGKTVKEIARAFKVSIRTVQRALASMRDACDRGQKL